MVKKSSKKRSFWRRLATGRNFIILFIVVFALAAFGIFWLDKQAAIKAQYVEDQSRYRYIEGRMATVMDSIVLTVGQPYELNHFKGCGHTAQEWGEGQLNCSNFYAFDYEVNTKSEGAQLASEISLKLKESARDHKIDAYDPEKSPELDDANFDERQNFGCDYTYTLFPADVHNDVLDKNYHMPVTSKYSARYIYRCGSNVTKALYPVAD